LGENGEKGEKQRDYTAGKGKGNHLHQKKDLVARSGSCEGPCKKEKVFRLVSDGKEQGWGGDDHEKQAGKKRCLDSVLGRGNPMISRGGCGHHPFLR